MPPPETPRRTPAKSHNQILFNSPALHSLKRTQLVNLCKMHSLKANGKNTELIERLKKRAADLPPDAINFTWEGSDEEGGDEQEEAETENELMTPNPFRETAQRGSGQWEIVMDDIQEVEENGMSATSTLASVTSVRTGNGPAGEFGASGSKSYVKSAFKAVIANSFGIRRGKATENTPQSGSTSRAGDPFAFPQAPEPEPIPGTLSRPGAPAPANARLSTGTRPGQTTTIRLVPSSAQGTDVPTPPRLTPYKTTLDLDMGSPGSELRRPVWPASPGHARRSARLYPTLALEDTAPIPSPFRSNFVPTVEISKATAAKSSQQHDMPLEGPDDVFSPAKPVSTPQGKVRTEARLSMPQGDPFLFGSPLPQPSLSNKQFGDAAANVLEEMNQRLAQAGVPRVEKTVLDPIEAIKAASAARRKSQMPEGRATVSDRYVEIHNKEFEKMDGIDTHWAARRPPADTSVPGTKKRKSDALALGRGRPSLVDPKPSASGTRAVSGGVRKKMSMPGSFGDDEVGVEQQENDADRRSSKRIRITEGEVHKGLPPSLAPSQKSQEEQRKHERDRQAMKRHLDKARRRSSRGRVNLNGKAATSKPARLGFFASAKKLVSNVWNLGASGGKAPSIPSVAKPQSTAKTDDNTKSIKPQSGMGMLKPPQTEANRLTTSGGSTGRSARSRSPIPDFSQPSTLAPRAGSALDGAAPLRFRPRSAAAGARTAPVQKPRTVSGSSAVMRANLAAMSDDLVPDAGKSGIPKRKHPTSTLMQPTASSLAKRQYSTRPEAGGRTLSPLPALGENSRLRPPSKIFSKPISRENFGSSPAGRSPLQASGTQNAMSLGTAAAAMFAKEDTSNKSKVPIPVRKPRVLRSRVIAKLGQQRAAAAAQNTPGRMRSSLSVLTPSKRSFGRPEAMMSAKKRVRQSEFYAARARS